MGKKPATKTEPAPAAQTSRLLPWLEKHAAAALLALLLLASGRIVSTYAVFNLTIDEPAHIACGLEWLSTGAYRLEPQHPPLARIAAALGPYAMGRRTVHLGGMYEEGAWDIYGDNHWDRNLALARLGILPFFWIAALVVYFWARRICSATPPAGSAPAALMAVFLFTFLPPILAHAGLATTDMALTAFVGAAFLTGLMLMEKPSVPRGLLFGACLGCAMLSKFSALPFLACAFTAALVVWALRDRPPWRTALHLALGRIPFLGAAALLACCLIWACYRFSFGFAPLVHMRVPAPEFFQGIQDVISHNSEGHPAYLLGMYSHFGWWYYYPVVLFFKSPLPFLILLAVGIAVMRAANGRTKGSPVRTAALMPLVFSCAILLFCFWSNINIGVRHILPVYMGFSVVAAAGAMRLLEMGKTANWAKWTISALLLWLAATSLLSHPDYIPYFNEFAGSEPEKILVDSDLDWGQDTKRLAKRLQELGARQVAFNPFIRTYLERAHGFPHIEPMDPQYPSPGWNAASITVMTVGMEKERNKGLHIWTDTVKPTGRIGKTTLLWYFPPEGASPR